MCHHMTLEEWQLLLDEKPREEVEPRTIEVRADSEDEPEAEREPERELIRV